MFVDFKSTLLSCAATTIIGARVVVFASCFGVLCFELIVFLLLLDAPLLLSVETLGSADMQECSYVFVLFVMDAAGSESSSSKRNKMLSSNHIALLRALHCDQDYCS